MKSRIILIITLCFCLTLSAFKCKVKGEEIKINKAKTLVILMEFPDYKHNSIKSNETDRYYADYSKEHYKDMLFGKDGYKGPNGESFISMRQYYSQQSGGTYIVEGDVLGWYTAKYNSTYYGKNVGESRGEHEKELVKEALQLASKEESIDFSKYDVEDRNDYDSDGNFNEPDGIIDHLIIVHAGIGEEEGGGALGENAIWSHQDNIDYKPYSIVDLKGNAIKGHNYMMNPEEGMVGIFCHEYGHDLGLPDEYDTKTTGEGEPVQFWSIMAVGGDAGLIPQTEPTGFSPWAKQFLQKKFGGHWFRGKSIDIGDIDRQGEDFILDEASFKGGNNDCIRINLPDKKHRINTPAKGIYEYFSGSGDNIDNSMIANIDLREIKKSTLKFKAWYDIQGVFNYASVQVRGKDGIWKDIKGNITDINNLITGTSNGWKNAEFDLTDYSGEKIELKISYHTAESPRNKAFYVDDIFICGDNKSIFYDNAEEVPRFRLNGFSKDNGLLKTSQYYLVEWRNQRGADKGLSHVKYKNGYISYDAGLVIWYVDDFYKDNFTGSVKNGGHPGEGFLGVIDSDQNLITCQLVSNSYNLFTEHAEIQMHDSAFSLRKSSKISLYYSNDKSLKTVDTTNLIHPFFDDSKSYIDSTIPDFGKKVSSYGLKIYVLSEGRERGLAKIHVCR